MTRQQMNDYLIQRTEQLLKDDPSLEKRIFNDYRAWVLALINNGKDQLMSKPTSDSKGVNGSEAGEAGAAESEQGGGEVGGGAENVV